MTVDSRLPFPFCERCWRKNLTIHTLSIYSKDFSEITCCNSDICKNAIKLYKEDEKREKND